MRPMTDTQAGTGELALGEYLVNEVFASIQGEGMMAGTPMVFLRFAKCNLRCTVASAGFDCDTDFDRGERLNIGEVVEAVRLNRGVEDWVLVTGGEPGLQLDDALVLALHREGLSIAVETNGTIVLPLHLDWVCCSPKSRPGTLELRYCDELKVVLRDGQALPSTGVFPVDARYYIASPAFDPPTAKQPHGRLRPATAAWAVRQVQENPRWRLSVQMHKVLGIR